MVCFWLAEFSGCFGWLSSQPFMSKGGMDLEGGTCMRDEWWTGCILVQEGTYTG